MNIVAVVSALGVLGVLGVVFGALLTVADKKFAVEADERVQNVRDVLPGANCGACGYVGCDSFAEAVVSGEAAPNGCSAGGASVAAAIGEALGVAVEASEPLVARVLCQGAGEIAKARYEYDGYKSCRVAASLSGGPKQCVYACLGLGDCELSCKFGAIKMSDGVAFIDESLCVGCGTCAKACPRYVISMKKRDERVVVRCRNSDGAKEAKAACAKACIACSRCVKECEVGAIKVENGFAYIDEAKCTRCGDCARVCPCKCITVEEV